MDRRGQYIGQGRRYYSRHSRLRPGMRPRPGFSEKSMSMLRPGVSMYPDWLPIRRNDHYYYNSRSSLRLGTRPDPRNAYRGRFVAQDTFSRRRNDAYADPQQETVDNAYTAPEQENYSSTYAEPQQESYGSTYTGAQQDSAYAAPEQNGYGSAYAEPQQDNAYSVPPQGGYGNPYAEPQGGYGNPYAEPQSSNPQGGYSNPYAEPQQTSRQQGGYGGAYSVPQQESYSNGYAASGQGGYGNPFVGGQQNQNGYSYSTGQKTGYTAYSSPQQEPYGNPFAQKNPQTDSYGNSPYGSPTQSSSYQPNGYAQPQAGAYRGNPFTNPQGPYQNPGYQSPQPEYTDDRFGAYAHETVNNTAAGDPFAQGKKSNGGFDYAMPPQAGRAARQGSGRAGVSEREKGRSSPFRLLLAGICFAATVYCAYRAGSIVLERWESQRYVNSLATAWVQTNTRTSTASAISSLENTQPGGDELIGSEVVENNDGLINENLEVAPISVNFGALQAVNSDVTAWIYCPDTVISYPVAQADDNDTYLYKLLSGKKNDCGTIFMDYRCFSDFSDPNTVLYGHNMRDKSMFGTIDQYADQSYYDQHPIMYLLTPTQDYKIKLIAGYVTPADGDIYSIPLAEQDVAQVVANAVANSTFISQVSWQEGDKLLTMSTCSYEYENARYVLMGVMEPLG